MTVMQYIRFERDHFYKKGDYNLGEDSNRYNVTLKETDFPHLIDGWISPKMLDIIVRDPTFYHKGEIS